MMKTEIEKAWLGESLQRKPIWLMRQAGRYLPEYRELRQKAGSFLNLCFAPQMAAEVTLQPMRRFDLDAAIVFSDILILPHALGQGLRFADGEGPLLEAIVDVDVLREIPDGNILNPVYETLEIVRSQLSPDKALIGFAGSPWTVASYMIEGRGGHDFSGILGLMRSNKEAFERIMDCLVLHTARHLKAQIAAGANAVQLFDSWAGVLSELEFERYVLIPNRKIIESVKAEYPDVPVIFFPRGCRQADIVKSISSGADVLAISQDMDTEFAAQNLQNKVCVQGNLAPDILLKGGALMQSEVDKICQNLNNGAFVFNLGHGVIKETPPEHVNALVDMVHNWKA